MSSKEEIQFDQTNSGRDADVKFGLFEGSSIILFAAALGVAIFLFRVAAEKWLMGTIESFVIASIPLILISLYVFLLKQGKPPSYDIDLLEQGMIKLTQKSFLDVKSVEKRNHPYYKDAEVD